MWCRRSFTGSLRNTVDFNGGNLAVQLTYSMFMTVFPLLLLLVTILGIVLADEPAWRSHVLNSAFHELPPSSVNSFRTTSTA